MTAAVGGTLALGARCGGGGALGAASSGPSCGTPASDSRVLTFPQVGAECRLVDEPLSQVDAKRRILGALEEGVVSFSKHARDEMAKDGLTQLDALNVLRGGVVDPAEIESGTWRYRVRTSRMCFVVAFRSEDEVRIVTAWRLK